MLLPSYEARLAIVRGRLTLASLVIGSIFALAASVKEQHDTFVSILTLTTI
jgi:hypothetical protein